MHEPISTYPPGRVLGSLRIARGRHLVDVVRIKNGSMTTFVERIRYAGPQGPVQVAFRRTDWFPSDAIADRFIGAWLDGRVSNQGYRVLSMDPEFHRN